MQDFSKKITIVVREDLASWQLTNTVGHISAYLGNKMKDSFDTEESFISKDGVKFPRNSQFAIVVLKADAESLKKLALDLKNTDLLWIVYFQEMIDFIDDEELSRALSSLDSNNMNILGLGMFGSKEKLKELTKSFKLYK